MSNLESKNFDQFFSELPQNANEKGLLFESVVKWWLAEHPIWSTHFKTIWHWNEWPGRRTRDIGIDLVAESYEEKLWAIQVKAYDPGSQLKKSDIDSFLSASNQKIFSDRLLVTTTRQMSENLRNTLNSQEKPVKVVNWDSLMESQIDWNLFANGRSVHKKKPYELRKHQQNAAEGVLRGFKNSSRGQLVMACGTGKTLTSIRIAEKLGGEITVVLLPSLTLLSQTLKEWLVERKSDFQWLAVCSDETVANDPSDSSKLIDYDFPVTTDSKEIARFLTGPGRKVIFSTYQSSPAVAGGLEKSSKTVNFLIADEAHRIAGKSSSEYSTFVRPSSLKVEKRLFMTATPRIFTSRAKKVANEAGIEINSMDDSELFGPCFFQYSFRQAIADGMLTDYRVVVVGISDLDIHESVEKRELIRAGVLETDAESLAMHIALSKAMKKWDMRRVISFHSRVSKATKFASDHIKVNEWLPSKFKQKGNLQTSVISSSVPTGTRRRILNQMKEMDEGESFLITNARCLTEGVDVPTLDGIAFVDPKSSQVDIVQAVGRAIRLGGKDKTHGTIVIPVFVPKGNDAEKILEASNYAPVSAVLNALRAHDEVLSENLDAVRRNLGKTGSLSGISDKIHFDLPKEVSKDFANRLKIYVIEKSSDDWEFTFGKLSEFVRLNGHARVVVRAGRKGEYNSLGSWIIKQRMDFHSGKLSKDKSDSLAGLPGWTWDPIEDGFRQNFEALQESLKEFGSIRNIPKGYVTKDGIKLAQWLMSVRSKQGQERIPKEKQAQFLTLPGWSWDFREDTWWAGYEAAKNWFENNNLNPGADVLIRETGYSLQNWIKVTLKQYRTGSFNSSFTPEKKQMLEQIRNWNLLSQGKLEQEYRGEKTSLASIRNMEQFIAGVEKYRLRFGDINFPITQNRKSYEFEGYPLGRWANGYRSAFKDGSIKTWEKNQLESIPGWIWDELEFKWNEGFQALIAYSERENSSQVPQAHKEGDYPLGTWVARQRRIKKGVAQGSFTREQIRKLEALPLWTWDASTSRSLSKRNQKWELHFRALEDYVSDHGTANLPFNYMKGEMALGRWVAYQRSAKAGKVKGAKITLEEIEKLEKLPGWKW